MALMTALAAQRRGNAPALIDEAGSCSWIALNSRVNRLIRALRAAGLEPGDRIAFFCGNSRQSFELMTAAHHAGVTYVPVNWHFTADELAHVLTDSQSVALFTDTRFASLALQALALAPDSAARLRVCALTSHADRTPDGFIGYEALIDAESDESEPEGQCAGGPMFYTSGTTGRPKGVVRLTDGPPPIESLKSMAQGMLATLALPPDGMTLLAGPYYHSAQWSFAFLPLLAGSTVVMTHRFDAAGTLRLIDDYRVTNLHLVPTQFIRLLRLDAPVKDAFDGSSLQCVWHGAAPCPPQVKREMIDWWGPCIHEYYGSTEGAVVTGISSAEWLKRPGSVGRVIQQTDVFILHEDGSAAPVGEHGTIWMRNRRGIAMQYHNDPAKTAAAHRGAGLFTTGDVGWMDAEGYLYLTDRLIDMIISGGVNIYPAEIEAVLATHPAVFDTAVIGVPNGEFGEEVKAIVQLAPGLRADDGLIESLLHHCRDALAGYKVPRTIEFRDTLPRTETGKLQKRLLREPYWAATGRSI
jgi:long-chain acyl-CoA synthetase